jgi:cytoskeletal protein CcmA (bactofilin family)
MIRFSSGRSAATREILASKITTPKGAIFDGQTRMEGKSERAKTKEK